MKHPLDLHRRRHRRTGFGRNELAGMLLVGIVGGLAWAMLPAAAPAPTAPAPAPRTAFGFCHSGGGTNCVVDGDTFRLAGDKIRIADIDTPETHPARCPEEARLGAAATQRLHALLNSGALTLHPIDRDTDRYGRKLRRVEVNGRGVGDTLVAEGLARPYRGRRMGWCDQS
ncbi:thermonuclease family protein [Sphingomonas sp.]|jgi:endonuclease YncB( thermonuclease family)|uniref:thermonuclease family protein n=1 Tax=Sphingomonas sp. TaxID=28214 RepID=UPI002E114193|nr:thermonuclease family protein [Sphingomonas sp.]